MFSDLIQKCPWHSNVPQNGTKYQEGLWGCYGNDGRIRSCLNLCTACLESWRAKENMKASKHVSVVFIRPIKFPHSANPPRDEILMWYWENWDNGSDQSSVRKHTQSGRHDEMQTQILIIYRALHSQLAGSYLHGLKSHHQTGDERKHQ